MLSPSSVISGLTLGAKTRFNDSNAFTLDEVLASIHHRSVRDLAWVIGCPSIVSRDLSDEFPDDDFFKKMLNLALPILSELDANPEALTNYLKQAKTKRLGEKFERYWQFWVSHCKGWEVVAADYQVNNSSRTIGAFDLLIQEPNKNGLSHWELAIKFYLNTGFGSRMSEWYGPNKQDRLDKKLNSMIEHQLKLGEYRSVKKLLEEKQWQIQRVKGIVKGRLFWKSGPNQRELPAWVNPTAARGFWCTATQFDSLQKRELLEWYLLGKEYWLSPLMSSDIETMQALSEDELRKIPDSINEAVHVVGCDRVTNREVKRGFLVPDDWLLSI